jgi:hypothetical protein
VRKEVGDDEYQIVINEAQRRLIMRALTNAMAYDRRSRELTHPTPYEWVQLIRLFSTIEQFRGSADFNSKAGLLPQPLPFAASHVRSYPCATRLISPLCPLGRSTWRGIWSAKVPARFAFRYGNDIPHDE